MHIGKTHRILAKDKTTVAFTLIGVEQVRARATSTRAQAEHPLVMSKKIELEWRPIMNWYEHSEIKMYDYIKVRERESRQTLFEDIKYSDFGEHTFYQGGWGPEPMIWSTNQEQGYVWCSEARQEQIQQWVRDTVFNCAPGND
jgi:hypothetical protein